MNRFKLVWFAALVAAGLALTSCSAGGETAVVPRDVSTPEKAMAVPCNEVVAVDKTIDELASATAPGPRNQLSRWSLDPNNPEQIAATQAALDERVAQCAASPSPTPSSTPTPSASPTASATASPSPTASATPTTTTTPTPSSTASTKPVGYVGWDQVIARPPAGLKDAIDANTVTMGFDWADVQVWAKAKTKNGNLVDARVILVFGEPDISDADARKQAGVETSDVDVVHVTECTNITGVACDIGSGVVTILAPLVLKDGIATGLRPGSGAVVGTDTLLIYVA